MRGKISGMLIVVMMVTFISQIIVSSNINTSQIKLGDYVQMGTYDTDGDGTGEPILWRCVAFEKISGTDANGNPITNSTDTVTEYQEGYLPLMLAETAVAKKEFDAEGSVTTGSHGRELFRSKGGSSNYWADSNIRDWLNSSAAAGNVIWTCGNAPSYKDEAGFLINFSEMEKAAMKTVTQKSLLAQEDYDALDADKKSGSANHVYNYNISNIVQNYSEAYSEQVTDTMFFLDVQQIYNVYANDAYLGGNRYYKLKGYWSRSINGSDFVRSVTENGLVANNYAGNTGFVQPAFYFNPQLTVSLVCGNGTNDKPYVLEHTKKNGGEVMVEPTCTEEGTRTYKCAVCEFIIKEEIPAKGHTEVIDARIDPTCTEKGKTEGSHCNICGEVITEQQVISATGHTFIESKWETDSDEHWHKCLVCDKSIDKAEHIKDSGTIIETPTFDRTGIREYKCMVCDKVVEQEEIPKLEPTPSPSSTATPTATPTLTPTATPSPTATPMATASPTPTATPTVEPTSSPSPTPTVEPTSSPSPTPTVTPIQPPEFEILQDEGMLKYNGEETVMVSVIFAKYNENTLESAVIQNYVLENGTVVNIPPNYDRIFIWDGIHTMKPLMKVQDIN